MLNYLPTALTPGWLVDWSGLSTPIGSSSATEVEVGGVWSFPVVQPFLNVRCAVLYRIEAVLKSWLKLLAVYGIRVDLSTHAWSNRLIVEVARFRIVHAVRRVNHLIRDLFSLIRCGVHPKIVSTTPSVASPSANVARERFYPFVHPGKRKSCINH